MGSQPHGDQATQQWAIPLLDAQLSRWRETNGMSLTRAIDHLYSARALRPFSRIVRDFYRHNPNPRLVAVPASAAMTTKTALLQVRKGMLSEIGRALGPDFWSAFSADGEVDPECVAADADPLKGLPLHTGFGPARTQSAPPPAWPPDDPMPGPAEGTRLSIAYLRPALFKQVVDPLIHGIKAGVICLEGIPEPITSDATALIPLILLRDGLWRFERDRDRLISTDREADATPSSYRNVRIRLNEIGVAPNLAFPREHIQRPALALRATEVPSPPPPVVTFPIETRGRRPEARLRVERQIEDQITSGTRSLAEIRGMKQESWTVDYGASRGTVAAAIKEIERRTQSSRCPHHF